MANDPRFEVYPQHSQPASGVGGPPVLTGEYGWRFRAANGQISAVSGEGFRDRTDARRAIKDFVLASDELAERFGDHDEPIIDVE